ncbi:MAG: alpha-ketoglutarate-dependent dioxygenase AlkB [Actinomyces sp.]|nr:MAG: alpha-ketoglutarate-dependent dioxygenase AlkB [Actinomyces sp.]
MARQTTLFDDPENSDGGVEVLPGDGSAVLYTGVLDAAAADHALATLTTTLAWRQQPVRVFGRTVAQPRLTAWYGEPGASYTYSGLRLEPLPWTPLLDTLRRLCEDLAGETFNSVLANLYRDGNDTVSWHADDEPELGAEPTIASLSLGATRRFHLRHRETRETVHVDLPAGSVLVMSGLSQRYWLHQVPRSRRVHEPRINLTFRRIGTATAPGGKT